jgi:FkbM family methyltransferase
MQKFTDKLRRVARKTFLERFTYGWRSYSQCGEDLIVRYIFLLRGITHPSYLDVGAHHPYYLNNTALFYHQGCKGINIEPNPDLLRQFTKSRPRDINLNVGVAPRSGSMDFYWMEDATLSTFSETEMQRSLGQGRKLKSKLALPVAPLNQIVSQYCDGQFPDFLTLDVEGMELEILHTIDFSLSRPKVICLETSIYSSTGEGAKRHDLMTLVEGQGYLLYADTNLNSIYVDRKFWHHSVPGPLES